MLLQQARSVLDGQSFNSLRIMADLYQQAASLGRDFLATEDARAVMQYHEELERRQHEDAEREVDILNIINSAGEHKAVLSQIACLVKAHRDLATRVSRGSVGETGAEVRKALNHFIARIVTAEDEEVIGDFLEECFALYF